VFAWSCGQISTSSS